MKATIKRISEQKFRQLIIPTLFEEELTSRAFGTVSYGTKRYKLGWKSEKIKPVIKQINIDICSLGVDQVFILFNLSAGKTIRRYFLDYFFYSVKIFDKKIYVITELEIIIISATSLDINEIHALPNYFEDIEFGDKLVTVKCIDHQIVTIK